MIRVENVFVYGWPAAIRGMRNPMNSGGNSDSIFTGCGGVSLGRADRKLAYSLADAGGSHAKFRRMIAVYADITAPLYWWKEFDTYKVGTVANSCSTMHKLTEKEFTLDDFSHEHLDIRCRDVMEEIIQVLNDYRKLYIEYDPDDFEIKGCPPKKMIWWQMIQLLPSSYNQKRTVMLNYEVLAHMYQDRKDHKLDEWRDFLSEMVKNLPYPGLFGWELDVERKSLT